MKSLFAEIEETEIVRVLLGHSLLRPHNSQNLPEPTQIQQSERLSTECPMVRHQAGGLVHFRDEGFKNFAGFLIATLKPWTYA